MGAWRTRVLPEQFLLLRRFGSRTVEPNGDTRSGRLRLRGSCLEPRSPPRTDADPPRAAPWPSALRVGDAAGVPAPPARGGRELRGPRCALCPVARGLEAWGAGEEQNRAASSASSQALTPPRGQERPAAHWGLESSFPSWACWRPSSLHPGCDPQTWPPASLGRVNGVCASWGCCQLQGTALGSLFRLFL